MASEKFNQGTFSSVEFLLESLESPKIKFGGSSSSTVLNRYFQRLSQDVSLMLTRTNTLAERARRLEMGAAAQSGALSAAFNSVVSRVDAASGYSQVLMEFWNGMYLHMPGTTADVNHYFGQATLPVISSTNLILFTDIYGNKFLSPETEIAWAVGSNPSALDFQRAHPEGLEMLKENQTWLLDAYNGDVWFTVKAPLQFKGMAPNVIELYPFPAFGVDLVEVAYKEAESSYSSLWTPIDLTYLPGYNPATQVVEQCGPVRIFLEGKGISIIRVHMRTRTNTAWGIHKFRVFHRQYASTATLTVKDPYSRTIGATIVRGKDPAALSDLTISKSGPQATVTLTTPDSTKTPVITGILADV
jgi:hypothetical protein